MLHQKLRRLLYKSSPLHYMSNTLWREPPASSRQFSANEVGVLND